jgi:hypothetical protein
MSMRSFNVNERPERGFAACIEGGVLEAQALLLFEAFVGTRVVAVIVPSTRFLRALDIRFP